MKKLRYLLKNPLSSLAVKAAIFGSFLALVKIGDFGLAPILFFLLSAGFLYSQPIFNSFALLSSFGVLTVLSLIGAKTIDGLFIFVIADIFFSFLFYLILGLKNLAFISRGQWYSALNLFLFYATFVIFFLSDRGGYFIPKSLVVFFAAFLLFREFVKFSAPEFKRRNLIAWVLALVIFEAVWAVSLLPLGFLNSANLMILPVFILSDLTSRYARGSLSRRAILVDVSIFILLMLTIFIASKWTV